MRIKNMKVVINNKLYKGSPKQCFKLMDLVHRKDMLKAGLWWEEDEKKFQDRYKNEDR